MPFFLHVTQHLPGRDRFELHSHWRLLWSAGMCARFTFNESQRVATSRSACLKLDLGVTRTMSPENCSEFVDVSLCELQTRSDFRLDWTALRV